MTSMSASDVFIFVSRLLQKGGENTVNGVSTPEEENMMSKKGNVVIKEKKSFYYKKKDSSVKLNFGKLTLCARFLEEDVDIPMSKNVRSEDVGDVSNYYVHMFTEERNSHVVKWIHFKAENGK